MAQRVEVLLVDDIDGSTAEETVTFSLDGTSYEIDLNSQHATELRDALARFVGHARKTAGGRKRAKRSGSDAAVIRQWAVKQGVPVPSHGRIPAEVREQYERASA